MFKTARQHGRHYSKALKDSVAKAGLGTNVVSS